MAKRGDATTISSHVYAKLRDDILAGRIAPGSRLRPGQLRETYNVSLSVVREVLTRLSEQRLVVAEPNLGFSVAPLSLKHLDELVEARCAVEGLTIRLSVEGGDLGWESTVLATHHRLEGTPIWLDEPGRTINPEWVVLHAEFHAALLEGCGNDILLSMCASLYDMAELYRRWNDSSENAERDVVGEHRAITTAALEHDADEAERLLVEHIRRTRDMAARGIPALELQAIQP